MAIDIIPDSEGGRYFKLTVPDYEYASTEDYLGEGFINSLYMNILIQRDMAGITYVPQGQERKLIFSHLYFSWQKQYAEILAREVPANLLALLTTERKKDQLRLTRGMSLKISDITAFIAKAGKDYGFTYSEYKSHHYNDGLDKTQLLVAFHQEDDGSLNVVGETNLSDKQLNHILAFRKVLIAKFLDKGDEWHCFVYTYKSLEGTEDGDWGTHIHYISSRWGIARDVVVAGIKDGRYPGSGLPHIKFERPFTMTSDAKRQAGSQSTKKLTN